MSLDLDTPIERLNQEDLRYILYGTNGEKLRLEYIKDGVKAEVSIMLMKVIINTLKRRYRETNSDYIKGEIEQYMSDNPCPKCKGARLNNEALAVTVGG